MLLPFQWAVLTVDEAKLLMAFIEKMTRTKGQQRNYDKMQKENILDLYNKIRQFVEDADHYERMRYFDPDDFERSR